MGHASPERLGCDDPKSVEAQVPQLERQGQPADLDMHVIRRQQSH
jgi:hypothetical protein